MDNSMDKLTFAIAQLNPVAGDIAGNARKLIAARREATAKKADIIIAPECYLSGYQIDDLVLVGGFLEAVASTIEQLASATADGGAAIILGAPRRDENGFIRNSVFVLDEGRVVAVRDKVKLAIGGVFDDPRNFTPGDMPSPVMLRDVLIGLPICEDMWHTDLPECLEESGAQMLIVINGSPFEAGKIDERIQQAVARVSETHLPLMYINLVGGADDVVFDGASFCLNPGGGMGACLPSFASTVAIVEATRTDEGWVFSGTITKPDEGACALYNAIVLGIRDYAAKNGFEQVLLGLSGGIDSALTLVLAVDALGAEQVDAVMLPSPYTSSMSLEDANTLASNLGVRLRQVDILPAMEAVDATLTRDALKDGVSGLAAENLQSRLRGVMLMTLSNSEGSLLLTTGNKSEYATGYATLYGDMCGGYAPLLDLWKTEVFSLAHWRNANTPQAGLGASGAVIPERIITRPPSAELRPDQKDSDSLPDYAILDAVMKHLIEDMDAPETLMKKGFDEDIVRFCATKLMIAEYKRRQCPPGPKLSSRSFYRDRRLPITNRYPLAGGV